MSRRIVLVAGDLLQSRTMSGLAPVLMTEFGFNAVTFCCGGATNPAISAREVSTSIGSDSLVCVNISDSNDLELLAARTAVDRDLPLVFCSEGDGTWQKSQFEKFHSVARLLLVPDEEERELAAPHFPNARVVSVGSAMYEDFSFPEATREEARKKAGVVDDETFILIVGEKEPSLNLPLAVSVIEAVCGLPNTENYAMIFAIHPGHILPLETFGAVYDGLPSYAPGINFRLNIRGREAWIPTPQMLPGADLVIGTNTTVLENAATLRIPAIASLLRGGFRGRTLPKEDKGWWKPCTRGAVYPIYGVSSAALRSAILDLLVVGEALHAPLSDFSPCSMQRAAQVRYYPRLTERGVTFTKMAQAITDLLGGK